MRVRRSFRSATFWSLTLLTFAMSWRLRNVEWWLGGLIGTVVSVALSEGLTRRNVQLQVFLQLQRLSLSIFACVAMCASAFAIVASAAHWPPSLRDALTPLVAWVGLGLFAGHGLRRLAARAASPSLIESHSRDAKAWLYVLLAAITVVPTGTWLQLAGYLAGISLGILMHALEREFWYVAARARRTDQLVTLTTSLTAGEHKALEALRAERFQRARKLCDSMDSYSARMIQAIVELLTSRAHKAVQQLEKALRLAATTEQRAKVCMLLALAHHDDGNEGAMLDAIAEVRALEPECRVLTVAAVTLVDPATITRVEAEAAHVALLRAEALARRRAALSGGEVTDQLVARAFGVDYSFFEDALGLTLLLLGNLPYAEKVLDGVIQAAPRSPMARFHLGMLFEARRDLVNVSSEKDEFADAAIINYELAVRLSPAGSLTSLRAARRLQHLYATKLPNLAT